MSGLLRVVMLSSPQGPQQGNHSRQVHLRLSEALGYSSQAPTRSIPRPLCHVASCLLCVLFSVL